MEGNILKKSRFIIFLKEIYTKDKFSCWLSVCMMLLSTFFVIFLPKLLQYIIDESMRGQQIKYILFFGGLYFFISLFNSLIIIKKEEILVRIKKSTLVRFKTRLLKKVSTLSGKALTEIKAGEMLNLIEGDTELLEACGLDIVFDTISNVITAILAIYILLKMQIGMFFVVFFLQLIVIWSQLKFTNILVEKTKKIRLKQDGENIKEYNLFSLRKQLSIATQNVYIKDDSIENNILMGRKKEDCAYDEICKLVGMESILSKFPKEKDVSVGENGNKLSGGQKQRIAMARALVHADNVLILDEATSALDNITQNEIMKNIKPLYQDKIVIIITHRLDTISDVDKIFVMSEGRICEEGQHNELMKKGEKYYALVQNL